MKKVLSALVVVAAVAMASSAMASIVNTKHDLSTNNLTGYSGSVKTTQVCVFCHTPHNSARTKALWNRNGQDASVFKTYTSGILMEGGVNWGYVTKGGLASNSSSVLCMTCHDGTTQMGALNNPPAGGLTDTAVVTGAANLGVTLTNDHPVNFNYDTAVTVLNAGPRGAVLKAAPALPFVGRNMECSTCHNVHDNTLVPFLRISIDGSKLCLECHAK